MKKRRGKAGGEDGPLWYEQCGAGCRQVFSPAGAAFLSKEAKAFLMGRSRC